MPLNEEQKQYIQDQVKNFEGRRWLDVLKTVVEDLYNSRGVDVNDIRPRQIAAQEIEKIVSLMEIGAEKIKPALNNEYR